MSVRFVFFLLSLCLPTTIVEGAEEAKFARHLIGCWQHGQIPSAAEGPQEIFMSRVCFEGAVEGTAKYFTCDGFGTFDCWDGVQQYALAERKLRIFSSDTGTGTCDAQIVPGKQLRLYNCEGAGVGFSERTYQWIEQ
jgi:hypothetical protein